MFNILTTDKIIQFYEVTRLSSYTEDATKLEYYS